MTKLKELRKARRLKLRELAEQLKITPQTVSQQEQQGIRTIRVARKYAAVFNCDWQKLID